MRKHPDHTNEILSKLPQIFDNYPDAALALRILEKDGEPVDYVYEYANEAACQVVNASRESFVGSSHNEFFGMPDPHIHLFHRAAREGIAGQQWLYNPEIMDFTDVSYSRLADDLCLVTGHFVDRSLVDARQTLAASMSAFDMIISVNLTKGIYHMINYDDFHNRKADDHGDFDTLIKVGASTLPLQWQAPFLAAFSRESQLARFARGQRIISLDHQQYSDDGTIHWVRTQAIRIENETSGDVIQVTTAKLIDDLKLGEELLRRERQAIYDSLPGGIMICRIGKNLPLLDWNEALAQQIGLIAKRSPNYLPAIHPQDREQAAQQIFECAQAREPIDLTFRVTGYSDTQTTRWIHLVGRPLSAQTKDVEYFFLSFDITHEKAQTEALAIERERYKELYDTSPCCIIEYIETPDGLMHQPTCNPQARKLMGCIGNDRFVQDICQHQHWTVSDITYSAEDARIYRDYSNRLEAPGDLISFESRRKGCLHSDLKHTFGTLELLEIQADGSRLMRNMYFDITDQKKAEADLAIKNETLRIAMRNTKLSYVYYYPQENRLQLLAGAHRFINPDTEYSNTLEDALHELVAPEHHESVLAAYRRAAAGENDIQLDCYLPKSKIWCRTRLSIVQRDETGRPSLIMGFIHDITKDHLRSTEMQETLNAIANSFDYIHRVHIPTQTVTAIRQTPHIERLIGKTTTITAALELLNQNVVPAHLWEEYSYFLDPYRIAHTLNPEHTVETHEFSLITENGQPCWMRASLILGSMRENCVDSYLVVLRDISAEKETESKVIEVSRERNEMSDAISAMFFAAFIVDLEKETYSTIKRSPNCDAQLPFEGTLSQLIKTHVAFLAPQDRQQAETLFCAEHLRKVLSPANPVVAAELPITEEDSVLWLRVSMVLTQQTAGIPMRSALIMQDVTAERELERQKQDALRAAQQSTHQAEIAMRAARVDGLTGVLNKKAYEEEISNYLNDSDSQQLAALFILDLDHFKEINDKYGHNVGDLVLCKIGALLKDCFPEPSIVGRIGGDEFAAFITGLSNRDAAFPYADHLAKRLQKLQIPELPGEQVTLSIGIAFAPAQGATFSELYQHADEAMYSHKRKGRNGYSVYSTQAENI